MPFTKPSLIVLEGLDATGKSTQADLLRYLNGVHVTHQPSGASGIGADIYKLTEQAIGLNNVARQFLHLACHAQHYQDEIIPALTNGISVVMDRCWWSTVAYGYFDGGVGKPLMNAEQFTEFAKLPTQGLMPDIVFLFNQPYQDDPHNTPALSEGYAWLASHTRHPSNLTRCPVYKVPNAAPLDVHSWMLGILGTEGIYDADFS